MSYNGDDDSFLTNGGSLASVITREIYSEKCHADQCREASWYNARGESRRGPRVIPRRHFPAP